MKNIEITINHDFLKLIAEIDEFKGKWTLFKTLTPERLNALRKIATIESVGSSTRIEGAKLTDSQVEVLLSNLKLTKFNTRDEQEVAGYAEAMDLVFESWEDLNITENHIKQLHQLLLKHSIKDEHHRGQYKKLSNNVVAIDTEGNEIGIIFETSSPFSTSYEMEELVQWFNKVIHEKTMHPLISISIFIVVFLAIHPFQDGNGRLSRILTTLLLLRSGYEYVPYSSLENIIEDNKELYYKALRRTQISLKQESKDWESWVGFFLRSLKKQKNKLAAKIEHVQTLDKTLSELSLKILNLLNTYPQLTIAKIVMLTNANQNTVKLRLRELVNIGYIKKHGKARATWYTQ